MRISINRSDDDDDDDDEGLTPNPELDGMKQQIGFFSAYLKEIAIRPPAIVPHRLLFIVFGGIGDTLLCENLFSHIKSVCPESIIHVLGSGFLPLLTRMPSIDSIIIAPPEKILYGSQSASLFKAFASHLAVQGYEKAVEVLAMVPYVGINSIYTGLILMASMAPFRIGRKTCGKLVWSDPRKNRQKSVIHIPDLCTAANHSFIPPPPSARNRHESLMLSETLGFGNIQPLRHPRLSTVDGISGLWSETLVESFSEKGRFLVAGVNMEATYPLKSWPEVRFVDVMEQLCKHGIKFVLVGRKRPLLEEQLKKRLKNAVMVLAGKTDLEELMALISHLDLFLSVDSGPAHLAQSYGVPTVVLFGPSNEYEFGPMSSRHKLIVARRDCGAIPCIMGPCTQGDSCMLNIEAKMVVSEFLKLAENVSNAPKEKLQKGAIEKEIHFFGVSDW